MKRKITITATLILILLSLGIGCIETQNEAAEINSTGFQDVTVEEVKQMIDNKEVFILDVRTQEEFDAGYIKGAVLIDVKELESRVDEVPLGEKILVYCRSGRRSITASNILIDAGHKDVYNMLGGINEWKAAGYPVVLPEGNIKE